MSEMNKIKGTQRFTSVEICWEGLIRLRISDLVLKKN